MDASFWHTEPITPASLNWEMKSACPGSTPAAMQQPSHEQQMQQMQMMMMQQMQMSQQQQQMQTGFGQPQPQVGMAQPVDDEDMDL